MTNLFLLGKTANITNQTWLNTLIITKYGWYVLFWCIMMNSGVIIILQATIYIKISLEKAILGGWLQTYYIYMNTTWSIHK